MRRIIYGFLLSALCAIVTSASIDVVGSVDPSSFHAIKDLVQAYKLIDPDVEVTITSSPNDHSTLQAIARQDIDFGVITTTMPPNLAAAHPSLYTLPLLLTSLVPVYRLDALGSTSVPLIIPRDILARIYLGEITNFQHPDLVSANRDIVLPNKNITLVLTNEVALTAHLKRALSQFSSAFNSSGISLDAVEDWPYHKYAAHRNISSGDGSTALLTAVATFDGSLSVYYHSGAVSMSANIARMTNLAGVVIDSTPSSFALAASELGTITLPTRTSIANLVDATNSAAWPMSLFSYVVVDIENTRSTCRTKESLIELLLYFYLSPVVSSLLADRNYAKVPDIIFERLGVSDFLQTRMMCRGNRAFLLPPTNKRLIGVAHQWLFNSRLLSSLYLDVDKEAVFVPQLASSNNLVVRQLENGEIDVGLINPANVDDALWNEFQNSGEFTIIPLFVTSIAWFFNPQFAADLNIKQLMPPGEKFRVDPELILLVYTACLTHWDHPKMIELNPWLEGVLANRSIRMNQMSSCAGDVQNGPVILEWAGQALAAQWETFTEAQSVRMMTCLSPDNPGLIMYGQALATCTSMEEHGVFYVDNELIVPELVLGRTASVGATVADNDPAKLFPTYAQYYQKKAYWSEPTIAGMYSCASDTYDQSTMTFDFSKSRMPDCYPLSRQTVAVVRKKYYSDPVVTNASSCVRGLDALELVRWLIETEDLGALTRSANLGRLAQVRPSIKQDYLNALNLVLCDEEPLLITLPVVWSLSPALTGFGCAAAGIGLFVTIVAFAFVCLYRHNPILRAASPLLILISLVGIACMFISIILFVMPPSEATCSGVMWLFSSGMAITFAPLFGKTWRIYRIFSRAKLSVVKISNRKLLSLCSVLLVLQFTVLVVWQALAPMIPTLLEIQQGSPVRMHQYTQCRSSSETGNTMFLVDAVLLGLMFVFGAYMCISTRKVSSSFNEASQIGWVIYNSIFTIAIIAIIISVTEPVGDVHVGLCLVVAIWISFFTVIMLVLPKGLQIFGKPDASNNSIAAVSHDSNSAFSFLSLDMFTSLPMIGGYISALRSHLEKVELKQAALKRGKLAIATKTTSIGPTNSITNTMNGLPQPSPSASIISSQDGGSSNRRSTSINTASAPAVLMSKRTAGAVMVNLSSRASQ